MKTADEIFGWLVCNCTYYVCPKSHEEIEKLVKDRKKDDGISLLCAVNSVPSFHAEYEKFVDFIGEPYSFRKHILPLINMGLITCTGYSTGGFYGTKKYKKLFDASWGCVKDYKTGQRYVNFWLGNKNH